MNALDLIYYFLAGSMVMLAAFLFLLLMSFEMFFNFVFSVVLISVAIFFGYGLVEVVLK